MERWINRTVVYQGHIITVEHGKVRLEDGAIAPREVVHHGGGVGIVPVLDGKVLLVKQYRIAVEKPVIEIPAGRLEADERPEHRARVELEEEIGYRAGRMIHVASCYCSPGFTNEKDHLFLAFDLAFVGQRLEFDERIEVISVPLDQVEAQLERLEYDDAKTIIGLRELLAYHQKQGGSFPS